MFDRDIMYIDAVREFRFVPLETVKRVDLIASIDSSGRGMFNTFIAVWQTPGGYGYAMLRSDAQEVLPRHVVDLDGTGVYRVIAANFPTGYQGATTDPITWNSVHALKEGKWIDLTDRYPRLSDDQFAVSALIFKLADAGLSGEKKDLELYRAYALFVRFKLERVIHHDTGAGLAIALQWAESSEHLIQRLAVLTFTEINDPRAVSALKKLAASSNFEVSHAAKNALAQKERDAGRK